MVISAEAIFPSRTSTSRWNVESRWSVVGSLHVLPVFYRYKRMVTQDIRAAFLGKVASFTTLPEKGILDVSCDCPFVRVVQY